MFFKKESIEQRKKPEIIDMIDKIEKDLDNMDTLTQKNSVDQVKNLETTKLDETNKQLNAPVQQININKEEIAVNEKEVYTPIQIKIEPSKYESELKEINLTNKSLKSSINNSFKECEVIKKRY